MRKRIALVGDKATSPACKKRIGTIIESANNMIMFGKTVTYDCCRIACDFPDNRNKKPYVY